MTLFLFVDSCYNIFAYGRTEASNLLGCLFFYKMKLFQELQQISAEYENGEVPIAEGLVHSQTKVLRTVLFYSNSKLLNGNKDKNGRELPFFNIVNGMVTTAVVATDIDTKDIRVEAEEPQDFDKSWLFNHEIQNWMKDSDFAETLNKMGETRARFGGVLVKKCIEDEEGEKGKLEIEVVEWKNLKTDQVNIEDGVIIEQHYLTPVELQRKKGVWDNLDEAIKLYAKKGHISTSERMEIWEVTGEFPESFLSDEDESEADEDYSLQKHFFAVKGSKFVHLYYEALKENTYKYLPWKERSGLPDGLGVGVVEEGEEAQVWTNDAIQKEQAAMEYSGKVIMKTNSKKIGNNIDELDNGSIVPLDDGKDINVLNLLNGSLPQFQNMADKWWSQYERTTSSYDAVRGETPPSGQPYRLQALVANSGASHFDYRREEWGIFLKEIFEDWVFPYIEKKLNKAHILASDFSPEELEKLDEAYAKYTATDYAKEQMLSGKPFTLEDYMTVQQGFKDVVGKTGKRRFLDIPDGYYKNMKSKLVINITGEQKNKMAAMESLNSMLQTMIPMVQMGIVSPENLQTILNKIIEMSGAGISPMSLSKGGMAQNVQGMQPQQPMQPNQQQNGQPTQAIQ